MKFLKVLAMGAGKMGKRRVNGKRETVNGTRSPFTVHRSLLGWRRWPGSRRLGRTHPGRALLGVSDPGQNLPRCQHPRPPDDQQREDVSKGATVTPTRQRGQYANDRGDPDGAQED